MSQQTNWVPTSVDLDKPSAARMYDYLLGGNHNFAIDRDAIDYALQFQPELKRFAVMNRSYLRRVVLFMIDQGIRQFLDLGSGIPTVGNVHEIAQGADPSSRVVYVDNEHVAAAHSQLMLENNENAVIIHGDVTTPRLVLADEQTRRTLDFDKPIGLLAVGIGHYVLDEHDADRVFAAYRDAVAPGSYLAISHFTDDFTLVEGEQFKEFMQKSQDPIRPRSHREVLELFGDFELVEPGLVTTSRWHPERPGSESSGFDERDGTYAGVARRT